MNILVLFTTTIKGCTSCIITRSWMEGFNAANAVSFNCHFINRNIIIVGVSEPKQIALKNKWLYTLIHIKFWRVQMYVKWVFGSLTPLYFWSVAKNANKSLYARNFIGCFLFRSDEPYKYVQNKSFLFMP